MFQSRVPYFQRRPSKKKCVIEEQRESIQPQEPEVLVEPARNLFNGFSPSSPHPLSIAFSSSSSSSPSISHSSSAAMAALEVNLKLLLQLQAMDFPFARAARALHSTRNVSIEEAVNWIIDHENDPFIDQAPSVTFDIDVEYSSSFILSEEIRKKTKNLMERVKRNEAKKERDQKEERRRNIELIKEEKEEEKSSRKKIPLRLEEDKATRQSKSSLPSTMSSKKTECMRECLKSLKQNYKDDIYKVRRAFQTLLVYVRNVVKDPDNEKFRKIRLTNPIFQERVGSLKGGIEFLEVCGFERREGGFLYLPPHKVDVNSLKSAGFLLNSALSNPFFGVLSL